MKRTRHPRRASSGDGRRPTRSQRLAHTSNAGRLGASALVVSCLVFLGAVAFAFGGAKERVLASASPVHSVNDRIELRPPPTAPTPAPGSVADDAAASPTIGVAVGRQFKCANPIVLDGDTIRCGEVRVRLASIDAPELPGHCRAGRQCVSGDPFASAEGLKVQIRGQAVECRQTDTDRYGRIVAFCSSAGNDLSCAQVRNGFAVVRYGALSCS
jgi:endonuclease YncB( thermonuclease family)